MNLLELNKEVDVAISNIKGNVKNILNIEELEMGLASAQALNYKEHIAHYDAEIRKRKLEQFGFKPVVINDLVRELIPNAKDIRSSPRFVGNHERDSIQFPIYVSKNGWFSSWTEALVLAEVNQLKAMIPAPILSDMEEVQKLSLVNCFYALGYPEAFKQARVDPIILAAICTESLREGPYTKSKFVWNPLAESSSLYFIGKYN